MNLDIQIKKIGHLDDIFQFYRYLTGKYEFNNHVFLESKVENTNQPLYSFVGANMDFILKIEDANLEFLNIQSNRGEKLREHFEAMRSKQTIKESLPFEDNIAYNLEALNLLDKIFPTQQTALPELFPRNIFSGGLCGYIGYDIVAPWVGYEASTPENFPDVVMGCFTQVLAYSHRTKTLYSIDNSLAGFEPGKDFSRDLDQFHENVFDPKINSEVDSHSIKYKSNTTETEWSTMIEQTKSHITEGDIIQAVISRKMRVSNQVDPLSVYEALRIINPSPYMYYLNFEGKDLGKIRIMGSSPEALITMNQGHLETVPIAGTRRRGRNAEDEQNMMTELLQDPKERAEHVMLVDLARNDLAKVSQPGTVETYEFLKLQKFQHVMHLISKVRSETNLGAIDVLKSMFPAGTVSGAPKHKAMEIIHRLEKECRGPYAGCVGYFSFAGNMDMAIAIRTMFNKDSTYIAQAGAGIVADSQPDLEFIETQNKLQGILQTIGTAEVLEQRRS